MSAFCTGIRERPCDANQGGMQLHGRQLLYHLVKIEMLKSSNVITNGTVQSVGKKNKKA